MIVMDEFYQRAAFRFSSEELIMMLQEIKNNKEKEIEMLKDKIRKYEQKKRAHEVWYQSLSPVRKFFAGRPPSHHQAVEYIVNVKERFAHIEQIRAKKIEIEKVIHVLQNDPEKERVVLANFIIEEIKEWNENGGL